MNQVALTLAAALLACPASAQAQTAAPQVPQGPGQSMLVLDASGSMWGQIGGKAKIEIAREAVASMLATWPASQQLGLMAYGHRSKGDCADIQMLKAPGPLDKASFGQAVNALQPKGMTPISASVRMAAEQLKFSEQKATVILVSDGEETCQADPCAVGKELEKLGVDFTAHVVGFDIDKNPKARAQLQCLASSTGGRYLDAKDAGELSTALREVAQAPAAPPPPPEPEPEVSLQVPESVPAGTTFELSWSETLHPHNRFYIVDQAGTRVRESGALKQSTKGTLQAPPTPGQYEVRYMAGDRIAGRAALAVVPVQQSITAPAQVQTGQEFNITWTQTLHQHNTVVIVPAGAKGNQGRTTEIYDQEKRTDRRITAPTTPGDFELRYMQGNAVMASTPLKVVQATQSLTSRPMVLAGNNVEVSWGQQLSAEDTVALVQPGAASAKGAVSSGRAERTLRRNLRAPKEPGRFDLIYVAARSGQVLARKPVEVVTGMSAEQAAAAQPTTVGTVPAPASPAPATPGGAKPAPAASTANANGGAITIGTLSNAGHRYLDGAGCYYQAPGARFDYDDQSTWQYRFLSTLGTQPEKAWAHLDGKVMALQRQGAPAPGKLAKGQRQQAIYQHGDLRLTIQSEVTRASAGRWETQATMTVQQGNRTGTTRMQGECGS